MTERYQPYSEYKESGEEWLGKVPDEWDILQIKHLSTVNRGASPRPIDDPKYFDDQGEYAWVRIADVSASDTYLTTTTQRLSELGSSLSVKLKPRELFLSIAGTVGKPCITKIKACIHDGFVYFPSLKIPSKYLFYIFAAGQAYLGLGKFGTQLNLNTDTVGAIKIGVPHVKEIDKIVDFLDHETVKIDTMIDKQQQLIKLLKEKRQAVISYAVTKGLNPDAPMKDSGVEWLGEVPEHWGVLRLRRIVRSIEQGKSPECENRLAGDDEWAVLKTGCVNGGIFRENEHKALPKTVLPNSGYEVKRDDLLMSRASGSIDLIGRVAYVEQTRSKLLLSDKVFRLSTNEKISKRYLWLLMNAPVVRVQIELAINGAEGLANNITKQSILSFQVALPPVPEQEKIIEQIVSQLSVFDRLIVKAEEMIVVVKERRTALISATVTGKIDVRNWKLGICMGSISSK